jgi:SAM-dependent MidA family methyltransferase
MSSYHPSNELPQPSNEQMDHSIQLIEKIIQHIEQAGGVISFQEYMQHCLYEPGLGYYTAGSTKFGAAGDFVTAPEISSLFGQCLANQAVQLFEKGLQRHILEFGAGTGKLCVNIVQRLNALGCDWSAYYILETSADLQQRQQQYLQLHLSPDDWSKIHWLSQLPENFNGLMLGNEVLDAMPVNVVVKDQQWIELGVGFSEQRFQWLEYSRDSDAVQAIRVIDQNDQLPQNYCTEINLNYAPWCRSVMQSCQQAVMLLIDYGYTREQYYHVARNTGTLMCFYQHRTHPDPFIFPGLQDITAFVDFDAFADAASSSGFKLMGMTTQAKFLINNGLLDLLANRAQGESEHLALAQQVKTLTLPGEMGDKFKVVGLQTGLDLQINGL